MTAYDVYQVYESLACDYYPVVFEPFYKADAPLTDLAFRIGRRSAAEMENWQLEQNCDFEIGQINDIIQEYGWDACGGNLFGAYRLAYALLVQDEILDELRQHVFSLLVFALYKALDGGTEIPAEGFEPIARRIAARARKTDTPRKLFARLVKQLEKQAAA